MPGTRRARTQNPRTVDPAEAAERSAPGTENDKPCDESPVRRAAPVAPRQGRRRGPLLFVGLFRCIRAVAQRTVLARLVSLEGDAGERVRRRALFVCCGHVVRNVVTGLDAAGAIEKRSDGSFWKD